MMTRRKKQTEIKEEVLTPQNKKVENMSQTNSNSPLAIAKRNEEIDHEEFQSPIFKIHIHMPSVNEKVSVPSIPLIQPVIHLHFDSMVKKLGSEENSSVKSSINNSVNKNLLNLLSMASPRTVNVTPNWDESSNSYSILKSSLENKNRNVENDQSEIELEYNCELNNRLSRKRVQSNKPVRKANKLKGLIQTKNNIEEIFNTRENDEDFKSIMPSLEKKINSLVRSRLRTSISSSNESDRECNNEVKNSVEDNCNLCSSSINLKKIFKLKEAVVKLEDIYCKTNFKLTSSDDHSKVKPNGSSCGLFNSSSEIASSGENGSGKGGYFLRTRTIPIKNSVTGYSLEMKQKSIAANEVKRMLHKNCNRKNTSITSSKNDKTSNTNSLPKKNFNAKESNKTPQKNVDPKIINKKYKLSGNSNDMENKTSTTPKNTDFLGNMSNNTLKKDKGRNSKNSSYTEEAVSDSDSTPQKNSATNDTEETEKKRKIDPDSVNGESSCSGELNLEEDVTVDKNVGRPKNSYQISNRGSHLDSESSDSDENIEIINCSKKLNLLEETPKTFLTSTQRTERGQLDETTKKPFNSHLSVTSSESEGSDADVSEECEDDLSESQTLLSLGKKNGEMYFSVYKSDNDEQVQALDKISLTSVNEGYNFSEILRKSQDKSSRNKIFNLARRRRTTMEIELREPSLEKKVQQEQKSITEKRDKNESSMVGSWEKSEKVREEEENETLDEESPWRFTNEDDKSTVEYFGDGLCTSKGAGDDRGSSREESVIAGFDCSNVLLRYPENEVLDKHYESDKIKKTRVKEFSLVSGERDEVDVGEKVNAWYEGQALESEEREPLDSTRFQLEYIKKEMLRRGLGIKSRKKTKRKSERKSKKKKPQKTRSPLPETSSSPQKKMKLSEGKSAPNKLKKKFLSEESYIPLETSGPTKFAVAPLDKLKPYQKHEALSYKEKMLFGDRVRRFSSSKEFEVYKMKCKKPG